MDLEEFDYCISFPNLNARRPSTEEQKDPVVFLFGWVGCEDKYLAKYSVIWEMEGCITVRYTAPSAYVFWKRDEAMPIIGQKLVGLIDELELKEHPIIFHVFSGGGCMVLDAFLKSLEMEPASDGEFSTRIYDGIIGTVFDSCPAKASYYQRALAYHSSGGANAQSSYYQEQISFWLSIFVFILWDVFSYFRNFLYEPHRHYFDELLRHRLPKNQLFLYSKGDAICSNDHISEFAAIQEGKELNRVQKICWQDSPHCQHLRYHEEEYKNAIAVFMAQTFDDEEPDFETIERPTVM